ncbi:MAG: TolC family protein [Gemmatimonadota bacterium]|nr:TolC family protein [Gemmatimonadota bacterium]
MRPRLALLAATAAAFSSTLATPRDAVATQERGIEPGMPGETLPDTLDLDTALDLALTRNPVLSQSRYATDIAGADKRAALGAFLPTANANLGLSRSTFTTSTFENPQGETEELPEPLSSESGSGNTGIGLSWTVFDASLIASLRESDANLDASRSRLDDQRLAVAARVQRAYIEAIRRQTLLELTRQQIADRELELEIAERRYQIAAVERSDVLGAEQNLISAEISLLNETSQLETNLRALSVEIGLPAEASEGTTLVDLTLLPDASGLNSETLVAYALGEDPELRALDADRAAASASLWGTKSRFLPTISLGYSWGWRDQFGPGANFFQFVYGSRSQGLSLSAQWTLFDGFNRVSTAQSATARRSQAEESLRQRRLEIERDVRRFLQQIDELAQTLVLLERGLQISEERLTMTRLQYQNGTTDFTALQQAISAVTSAERQLIEARYNYLASWVDLEEYVGDIR